MASRLPRQSELKAGAALSYTVIAVQFLIGILFTPIILRVLGQAEYGLYDLSSSIISYLNLLTFGFTGAYMRFYSRSHARGDLIGIARLNGLFILIFGTAAILASILGVLLALNTNMVLGAEFDTHELSTAKYLFLILTLNVAITLPTSVFSSFIVAHERFIVQKTIQLMRISITPIFMVVSLAMDLGSIGLAIATTFTNAVFSLYTCYFAIVRLKMRFIFRQLPFGLFKEVTVFSSFIFINIVVDQINWNIDRFIIGRYHGSIAVAVYGVAALFNSMYLSFSTAISSVFVPRVNKLVAGNQQNSVLRSLFIKVGRVQFMVLSLVLTGVIFFGKPFIALWAGPNYSDSYPIMLLLMVPVTIPLIQNLGIEIQKARNMHHFRTWTYLIAAVLNILITIPVTEEFGAIGAATVTSATLLLANGFIMNWYYDRRMGLGVVEFWRQIVRMSVGIMPACLTAGTFLYFFNLASWLSLVATVIGYSLIYSIGMWFLGMNDFEKQLVRSIVGRIKLPRIR